MTVEYARPDGHIVRLSSPGIFYDYFSEYDDDEIIFELHYMRRRCAENTAMPEEKRKQVAVWLDPWIFERLIACAEEELTRRGVPIP